MNKRTLYIGNLSLRASEADLYAKFQPFGEVDAVWIDSKHKHMAPGGYTFGFVRFVNQESAEAILRVNPTVEIHSRIVLIKERDNKRSRMSPEIKVAEAPANPSGVKQQAVQQAQKRPHAEAEQPPPYDTPQIELDYSEDGLLRIRDNPIGYVVRISQIPATWDAANLFYFLVTAQLCVCATLIYSDVDERGFRGGLAQFVSKTSAEEVCQSGFVMSQGMFLGLDECEISSIGPIRRTYAGIHSAYNPNDTFQQTVSEEALSPPCGVGEHSERPVRRQMALTPIDSDTHSPGASTFSPTQLKAKFSPVLRAFKENKDCSALVSPVSMGASPSNYISREPRTPLKELNVTDTLAMDMTRIDNSDAIFKPMVSYSMPLRPSHTLVVDNIDARVANKSGCIRILAEKYGDVVDVDMLYLTRNKMRAYILYESPYQAAEATKRLHMYTSGAFTLSTRLA